MPFVVIMLAVVLLGAVGFVATGRRMAPVGGGRGSARAKGAPRGQAAPKGRAVAKVEWPDEVKPDESKKVDQ
jgi:hypothetical protein